MRVYIAGPMRGLPRWNFAAFAAAKERWEAAGHHVFCPATIATALGYGSEDPAPCEPDTEVCRAHLRHVMLSDILCLTNADAIVLLPGWEQSRGATCELAVAQFLGLRVFDAETMELLSPDRCPWH